ncbi:MAG: hypothetical protein WDO74_06700 [Pseudomonadota bacterium]
MRRGLVVVLALGFAQGCSTGYEPARSPRIATVLEGGQPTFVKDGVHFGSPVFGTGIVDAVQGNPQAEHHARIGRNLIVGGFVLDLVGLGSEIGGLVVLAHDRDQHGDASPAAVGLVLGGLVAVTAGTVMILCGQPHVYDAINIYNDGVDGQPSAAPLGPRVH